MRADRLDPERPEDERQDVRAGRIAVVDDDPEATVADRLAVERREQVLRVGLTNPSGIADAADGVVRRSPELEPGEVLLDLLLHRAGELDPGVLEEADLDDLGVGVADADVEAGVEALRLEQMP